MSRFVGSQSSRAARWLHRLAPGTMLRYRHHDLLDRLNGAWLVLNCQVEVLPGPWVQLKVTVLHQDKIKQLSYEEAEFHALWEAVEP